MTAHDWHRPNFFSRDLCRRCLIARTDAVAAELCAGLPMRDADPNLFAIVEKTLVDYFDTTNEATVQEASEWYLEIAGRRISLSELALVVAQEVARAL